MYIEQTFEPAPEEIGAARRFVRRAAGDWEVAADLVLVASELATNAIRHAGTAFEVWLKVDSVIRLEVADESDVMPTKAVGGITNHGLDIVGFLAARVGSGD